MDARTKELEGLLVHSSWVRQLARRLVGDDAAADDIVQDVWVAALAERGPLAAPRSWAARVVHNLAASARRTGANLAARERGAAREERQPSVEEVACRAELEHRLVERVHGLPERQRDVLLLRYFEGLAPLEISRQLEIPIATVRSRSARALETLRVQLDGEYGERHAWHAAFGPLALARPGAAAAGTSSVALAALAKLGLGALLVAAPLVWWSQDGAVAPAKALQASYPAQELVAVVPEGPGEEEATAPAMSRREEVAMLSPRIAVAAAQQAIQPTPAAPSIVVRGEVILRDEQGELQSSITGKGMVQLWRGTVSQYRTIAVEHGHFQFTIETPADLVLWSATLDGRICQPETIGERFFTDGTLLTLRMIPSAEIELSILDASSLQHLDGVELWDCTSMPSGALFIPDMHWNKRALENRRSPLVLHALPEEFQRKSWRYLVRSPGHAWTPLKLDMRKSGSYELHLQRSAQLDVDLQGGRPQAQAAHMRLYREAAHDGTFTSLVSEEFIAYQTQFEFQGLPAGAYQVRVEIGGKGSSGATLAQSDVKLEEGAHERVSLMPRALEKPTFAPLAGTVHVPLAWEVGEIFVFATLNEPALGGARSHSVLSQEELQAVPGTPGFFLFRFDALQTGDYTVGVGDKQRTMAVDTSLEVELGPDGLDSVLLLVPKPASVRVILLDGSSGPRVDLAPLWGRKMGLQSAHTLLRTAVFDPETLTHNFRAPVGELSLFVWDDEHVPIVEEVTVHEGSNTFTFVLEPVCSVRVRFQKSDEIFPMAEDWRPDVENLEKGGYFLGAARDGEDWSLRFSKPGHYRMAGWKIAGFEFIDSIDLLVERDVALEYSVEMTPE